jgi:ribonuclease H / adenosylcobalamin/alpha-ribazole phosphatase
MALPRPSAVAGLRPARWTPPSDQRRTTNDAGGSPKRGDQLLRVRVYIWCDGAAMPNGGPAGAGYVVVGGVHLLASEALGDATNNVAEYTAVRNALRAAADAGATSAHVRMDSPVVFGHLSGKSRARAAHLIQLKEEVQAQVARYPGRVVFTRIPRERNGVADELAKNGARASKALAADGRR